jgi:uncharacterized protein (TIGR02266 family)
MEIQERRKYFRIKLIIKVKTIREERFHYFYSRDLSIGGIFLETDTPYPTGTNLDLEVPLPEVADKIKITGTVVRVVPLEDRQKGDIPGMGLHFSKIDPDDKAMLADFIAREMARE